MLVQTSGQLPQAACTTPKTNKEKVWHQTRCKSPSHWSPGHRRPQLDLVDPDIAPDATPQNATGVGRGGG